MSTQCLKLAFIGGGANSAVGYVHFSAAQLDNRFKVVAGAFSRHEDCNVATAQQWGIAAEHTYSDWREMLSYERDNIDAVVVLTPTPHHLEVLETLLQLNVPTICEKSLVCGSTEIAQLEKAYNPEKHFLAVTFNYSGYAMVRELRNLIKSNKLGRIQKIHLEMPQEGFKRPPEIAGKAAPPQSWRLKDYAVPTICLDLGVHLHHLSSYLLDLEPLQTSALFATHSEYTELVDDVQMLLKYPQNVTGSMWMSKTAIGHRNGLRVRIYGTEGSAHWYQLNPDELELNYNDGRREILDRAGQCQYAHQFRYNRMKPGHPTGFVEAFANLYTDIHDALSSYLNAQPVSNEYVFGFSQAKDGLALFEAATRSSKTGQWENL
ncbi:hypothetical protein N480_01265 [Pseudoalteromonas luteoviolacea S2607]|uniref:Gfo/Idh/MocA family protein n=1 Tax=Pseudoalteromonas luteoviolacea TaxID=43657 RepID=UPI0007B0664E|nr:Gfo/Idh/MocA family oxidoreductase [Pseudoalteromonas luteoviolacea]KZN39492.1 hypothetical protein N480_01265 [Pseudoalteromonas luteoviolacea S2607]